MPLASIMVNFELTDEQQMLQELARNFSNEEIQPNAPHWEKESIHPKEAITKTNELGLLTLKIPEKYGGGGLGSFEEFLVLEEFGFGDPSFATAAGSSMLASYPLITGRTEAQKENYLRMVTEGKIAVYCVAAPGAGSDVQAIQTEAVKDGDEYVINGQKM